MKPYSVEPRERVASAVGRREGTLEQIARRFCASVPLISRLRGKRRQSGSLAPMPQGCGQLPALTDEGENMGMLTTGGDAVAGPDGGEDEEPTALIGPSPGWAAFDLRELWEFRDLLYILAERDLRVRYKQTAFGVGWAILQPLLTMLTFTLVFGRFARVPTEGVPYPVLALAALLPWNCFAQSLNRTSMSLVSNSDLVSKVYFPRLIIPISATATPLADFAVAFLLLLGLMLWYGTYPTWRVVAVPALLLATLAVAFSAGLWLAAINVQYRDVGYVIPLLVQIWMFLSPVAYPASLVPERWRTLYNLNPMSGVIGGFRWALLGGPAPDALPLAGSALAVVALLLGGFVYFRRTEASLVDVI